MFIGANSLRKPGQAIRPKSDRPISMILPAGTPKPPKFRMPAGTYDPQKDIYYQLKLLRPHNSGENQNCAMAYHHIGEVYIHFHCGKVLRQLEVFKDGSPVRWADARKGHDMYNMTRHSLINFRGRLEFDHDDFQQMWWHHVGEAGGKPDRARGSKEAEEESSEPQGWFMTDSKSNSPARKEEELPCDVISRMCQRQSARLTMESVTKATSLLEDTSSVSIFLNQEIEFDTNGGIEMRSLTSQGSNTTAGSATHCGLSNTTPEVEIIEIEERITRTLQTDNHGGKSIAVR